MTTETDKNLEKYMTLVATLDPELYRIKMSLIDTKVNPIYLPAIIRAISNIAYGTGYGKVQVFIENGIVSAIKPEESLQINLPAILPDA